MAVRTTVKLTRLLVAASALALAACSANPPPAAPAAPHASSDAELLARGEYLISMGGCNDCHTPGYGEKSGDVPKDQWLTGDVIGFSGPWGTTYPANLRLKLADMDETAWMKYSGELHTRPIMPDFQLRAMHEDDRRAVFAFIKSLGPAGQPAPAYLPPGQTPPAPHWQLVLPSGPPPADPPTSS
ncbi:MAG: cytochrome C [Thermomonas sp.]